jgi:hypothetical protein
MALQESSLKELEDIEDNRHNLRRLRKQLRSPIGIIPFVGAGLSMPFGFPSWSGFLIQQAQKAGIETKIKRRLAKGEYEEAAEDLLAARRRRAFVDAIGNAFGFHNLEGKELKGAVCLVPQLASGPVITTNFDHVLEEVFKQAGVPFEREIWGANADISTEALNQHKRFLIKIHGDAEDGENRVLTKNDYARHYGSSDGSSINFKLPLPRLLRRVLLGRALLFLGCSLNQDRTIGVLEDVSKSDDSIAHYAIVEQPKSKKRFYERSQFLSEHNIRPIWYPHGHHDIIEPLLAHVIGKSIPMQPGAANASPPQASSGENKQSSTGSPRSGVLALPAVFTMKDAIATFRRDVVYPDEAREVLEYLEGQRKMLDESHSLHPKKYALKPRLQALIREIQPFRNKRSSSSRSKKDDILNELLAISNDLASLQ